MKTNYIEQDQLGSSRKFWRKQNEVVIANVQIKDINTSKDNKRDICIFLAKYRDKREERMNSSMTEYEL